MKAEKSREQGSTASYGAHSMIIQCATETELTPKNAIKVKMRMHKKEKLIFFVKKSKKTRLENGQQKITN